MSGETTSEVTEQQVSTVEEDLPKQPKPDLSNNDDEPTPSSSRVLRTVLTHSKIKRPLPDGVDSDKKKKNRVTEVSEDKLEIIDKEQRLTKNTDETKSIESPCNTYSNTNNNKKVDVCSNGIDQNVEAMDSDIASHDLTDLSEDIRSIISGVQQTTRESFPQLLQLFSSKNVTFDQFSSMCTQKIIEVMTEKGFCGKYRTQLQLSKEKEKFWRTKYVLLDRQLKEIISALNVHKQELKTNENARPRKVTRTVGVQAVIRCTRKEGSMKLPKQVIPLAKPNPVSIIVEDDYDVVELGTVESASSSTSKIPNITTKKQMSPLVTTSKSLVVSPKKVTASPKNVTASPKNVTTSPKNVTASPKNVTASPKDFTATPKNVTASPKTVPAAKSSNPINIGTTPTTIDLTENDDIIEESNIINLENTTSPIKILQRSSASILPVGTVMNGNAKSYTFVELPNNPSSSSSFIIKTASCSPHKTAIPLSSGVWKHPSPVPGIPNQKNLSTWKRLPPAPNLSINQPEAHDMPQAPNLSWTMNINKTIAEVIRYQIYAYLERSNQPPNINLWRKVGEVNAHPLPMSCSLTHFSDGKKYHFIVRAVDVYNRVGPFSSPKSIT